MNPITISPANARFWVRPYEFEGDGSTGAADDIASLEIGGKSRTFWLKTLENRLFFREIGRDENWNFGALDELQSDNLPLELARVLANENYGRVVLLEGELRPCFGLTNPNGQVKCYVPNHSLSVISFWTMKDANDKSTAERENTHFIEWPLKGLYPNRSSQLFHEFRRSLKRLPAPIIELRWIRGSSSELDNVLKSFIVHYWSDLVANSPYTDTVRGISWNYATAWQMGAPSFHLTCYFDLGPRSGHYLWLGGAPEIAEFIDVIVEQFLVVGQGENSADKKCCPYIARARISQPTHHEILEAHLYLRDWINQKLPPAKAEKWLDFS